MYQTATNSSSSELDGFCQIFRRILVSAICWKRREKLREHADKHDPLAASHRSSVHHGEDAPAPRQFGVLLNPQALEGVREDGEEEGSLQGGGGPCDEEEDREDEVQRQENLPVLQQIRSHTLTTCHQLASSSTQAPHLLPPPLQQQRNSDQHNQR
eukprot:118715-Hanusia_phi.AAC.2